MRAQNFSAVQNDLRLLAENHANKAVQGARRGVEELSALLVCLIFAPTHARKLGQILGAAFANGLGALENVSDHLPVVLVGAVFRCEVGDWH